MRKILLCALIICPAFLHAEDLKARLGVELRGNVPRAAKARDTVRAGDRIAAYAQPSQNCSLYVVISHAGKTWLLNAKPYTAVKDVAEAYPNLESGWQIPAGQGPVEIMLIVSAVPLNEVAALQKSVSTDEWRKVEKRLRDEERMRDSSGKPVPVAANVRSIGAEAFTRKLPVYSGAALISARFFLEVQNQR